MYAACTFFKFFFILFSYLYRFSHSIECFISVKGYRWHTARIDRFAHICTLPIDDFTREFVVYSRRKLRRPFSRVLGTFDLFFFHYRSQLTCEMSFRSYLEIGKTDYRENISTLATEIIIHIFEKKKKMMVLESCK